MDAHTNAENFVRWMLLEAKASREGMSVNPVVESVAICVDETMRETCGKLLRPANEREDEIRKFSQKE